MTEGHSVTFNSLLFMLFLPLVLAVHYLPLPWTLRKVNLIGLSYLFYAAWHPPYVVLLWVCTVVDWFIAKGLARSTSLRERRAMLAASIAVNLGILVVFKYAGMLVESAGRLARFAGLHVQFAAPDILLPIGISFFVFMSLSYTIDLYRGHTEPCKSFTDYALFITFFPHLVSGPIVRASHFLPQCEAPRKATGHQFGWGAVLILCGLFQKVVLADQFMAPMAAKLFDKPVVPDMLSAWIGAMAFSIQILADFSGYTMCAVGIALMLGFEFPDNFRYPYAAIGFSDFWRRWHISLSSWLRDYLYIGLGGNRRGTARTYGNLMLTMLLGGLWHGAAWHFVAWGGLHGAYLVLERLLRPLFPSRWKNAATRLIAAVATYACVCVAWVFFRASSVASAVTICRSLSPIGPMGSIRLFGKDSIPLLGVILSALLFQWLMRNTSLEAVARRVPWWGRAVLMAAMMAAIVMSPGEDRAFIYFAF
jgi:D-alanyl-lipoteichoic acid acyltransferase DltB (MBOAT superfamily)